MDRADLVVRSPRTRVLRRVTSRYLYDAPRDLFATNIMEANKIVIGPALERAFKARRVTFWFA